MDCCERHASELRCNYCPWCRIAELEAALSDIAKSGCVFLNTCTDVDISTDEWCPPCKARQALLPGGDER